MGTTKEIWYSGVAVQQREALPNSAVLSSSTERTQGLGHLLAKRNEQPFVLSRTQCLLAALCLSFLQLKRFFLFLPIDREMAARHSCRSRSIQVIRTDVVPANKTLRKHVQQFHVRCSQQAKRSRGMEEGTVRVVLKCHDDCVLLTSGGEADCRMYPRTVAAH